MNPKRQTRDAALARPEQLVQYIVPLLVKATKVVRSVGSVGSVGFWVYQSWSVFYSSFCWVWESLAEEVCFSPSASSFQH